MGVLDAKVAVIPDATSAMALDGATSFVDGGTTAICVHLW
jgi:hypothetical protein